MHVPLRCGGKTGARPFAPLTAAVRPLLHEADTAAATAAAAAIAADLVKAERGLRVSEL